MKTDLEKEILGHREQVSKLEEASVFENKDEIEKLKKIIEDKEEQLKEFGAEKIEKDLADIDSKSKLSKEKKAEIKNKEGVDEKTEELEKEANEIEEEIKSQERMENLEDRYKKEILPIIEIIKPEEISFDEYEGQVLNDLFESVKKQQVNSGVLITSPEKTLGDVKDLLNSRLKAILEDARNNDEKNKPDEYLVKKAKIAMLFQNDLTDLKKYSSREGKEFSISNLKDYIVGSRGSHSNPEKAFAESDIDSLMKTKYRKNLTDSPHYDYNNSVGNNENSKVIPESLMIGLAQSEMTDRYWPIKYGLESATEEKYDNGCLEQLLASDHTKILLENFKKFKGKPLEKILESGGLSDGDGINLLMYFDMPEDDFNRYVSILVKHNVGGAIRNDFGKFNKKNHETIELDYKETIEKLHKIEMDTYNKTPDNPEDLVTIKEIVHDGNIGLALATYECKKYIQTYSETDYENFLKDVSQHDQEHLVFQYLKEEDKIKYAYKLIDQGKEYQIVKLNKLFGEHSISPDIYNKIKEAGFAPTLKGKLSAFKDLSPEEALEFIKSDRTDMFTSNLKSFSFPENFLKTPEVQEACLKEFKKELSSLVNLDFALNIFDQIPFPKEVTDKAIKEEIDRRWLKNERIDWACSLIQKFPHIKEYLQTPEIQKMSLQDLKNKFTKEYASTALDILESFPIPESDLNTDEMIDLCNRSIEASSKGLGSNNRNLKEDIGRYFATIEGISKYIKVPEYLLQQKNKIVELYSVDDSNGLKYIQDECAPKILGSKTPDTKFNDLKLLADEIKNCKRINSHAFFINKYVSKFENNGNPGEKEEFIKYIEKVTENVDDIVINNNFDYLVNNFSNLPDTEMSKHKELLEGIVKRLNSTFFKDIEFPKIFDRLTAYSPQQQQEMLRLTGLKPNDFSNSQDQKKWSENLVFYINDFEDVYAIGGKSEERKKQLETMFGGEYKDVVLDGMNKEWQDFLKNEENLMPPNLFLISKLINEAGGAGNLKHVESIGNLAYQLNSVVENSKTADRTKKEIKDLLLLQERRFDKEKWLGDDRSEFYNLSSDIIRAAPSLYASFSPIFENLSPKEMKTFVKEVFPFYQAQLDIDQEIDGDDIKYKPKDLVKIRQSINDFSNVVTQPDGNIKDIFKNEKARLLEIIKDGFKSRFGLMKVPEEFTKEDLRSIQNSIRYIGNISNRTVERETNIAFYLGLKLNGQWEDFRQCKDIKLEEYFSGDRYEIIKSLVNEKQKGYEKLSSVAGISAEQFSRFQEILQEDTISNIVGNIQTIDLKLGNIKRNISELTDPDIYENKSDKELVSLLAQEGKSVGAVLAKIYSESSGKSIVLNEKERAIQTKIASIFNVPQWNTEEVKKIQDAIQPLSLVSNMISKMDDEKVDKKISELQKRLMPTSRIIEIFNRIGEEFKQESGAMALSKDITYLENLMVKDDKKFTEGEKNEVSEYLNSIRDKMKELENTFDKVKEYFTKIKKSTHLENHHLLKNRLADIEKIINSEGSNDMIISHMTKDLNLIIENMRQCLGCMRKETNNDTNLAFGDYNKFYMMSQSGKEKGSTSDEIVFFLPIKTPDGSEEMSFVLDKVYGSQTPDVLIGNILAIYKKYSAMKKEAPDARISISVSSIAMSSVNIDSELLKKKLKEVISDIQYAEDEEGFSADVPKSAFGDNYIEFGKGDARKTGEREFRGLVLR